MSDAEGRTPHGASVPSWAQFMEPANFQALVDLVSAELERRAIPFVPEIDAGTIRVRPSGAEWAVLGLVNLAQMCHQSDFHLWPEIVASHIGRSVDLAAESDDAVEQMINDFAQARERLKIRLYPADIGGDVFLTIRQPMEDVKAVLVYDMPETIHSVRQDHVDAWNVPLDDLFAIAMANIKAEEPVDEQSFEAASGAPIKALSGGSFFTASHVLCLDDYLNPPPPWGTIVAIPHRHAVLYHPIVDQAVMPAIQSLIPMAQGMFQEGPGSISPHLYWWRDGRFTLLPVEVTDASIVFKPPDEFVDVLNQIFS